MKNAKTPLEYAQWSCDTMMHIPAKELPPVGGFHYHQGVFLMGMQKVYELTGEKKYLDYIKAWVDSVVNEDATIKRYIPSELDDLMPGMLLYNLYDETGDEKYKKLLDLLKSDVDNIPQNALGGFWHKVNFDNQMWLDGLFMGGPFMVNYASRYGVDDYYEIVNRQINLMWDNMRDETTGLLYHAWDYSKMVEWADKKTGLASQFWGRALGWYVVALMDIYEFMPDKYKEDIAKKEQLLVDALLKYQMDNGLWCQVINRIDDPKNWPELSCSSLFACGIAKAVRLGVLSEKYFVYAEKAFAGVVSMLEVDETGGLQVGHVCIGTGVGDYQFYLDRPVSKNDLHGVGAFLYMCGELEITKRYIEKN